MKNPTLEALEKVQTILHDASWDQLPKTPASDLSEEYLRKLRKSYLDLLRQDYVDILEQTLRKGVSVKEVSENLGLSEGETKQLLCEALNRLSDFVDVLHVPNDSLADNAAIPTA